MTYLGIDTAARSSAAQAKLLKQNGGGCCRICRIGGDTNEQQRADILHDS